MSLGLERKRLRRLKREGAPYLREARRVLKSARKALSPEERAPLQAAIAAYELALREGSPTGAAAELRQLNYLLDTDYLRFRKSALREWTESLLVAALAVLILRSFVLGTFTIPSGSMIPTLRVGDRIFVSKLHYGMQLPILNKHILDWAMPERGDIIVFVYPVNPDLDFIKRVIGLPGDKITVDGTTVTVNGKTILQDNPRPFPYLNEAGETLEPTRYDARYGKHRFDVLYDPMREHQRSEYTVPPGHLFVMGDNRDNSADSRVWGFVPMDNVKGRALLVLVSYSDQEGLRLERLGHVLD